MADKDDKCPLCGANLRGDEIPQEHRQHYGNKTHFSRVFAIYDRGRDRTVEYQCPDCNGRWPRPQG